MSCLKALLVRSRNHPSSTSLLEILRSARKLLCFSSSMASWSFGNQVGGLFSLSHEKLKYFLKFLSSKISVNFFGFSAIFFLISYNHFDSGKYAHQPIKLFPDSICT